MAKKLVSMKFEPELLARVDARSKATGIDRTAFFTMAAEDALNVGAQKPRKQASTTAKAKPRKGSASVPNSPNTAPIVVRKRVPRQPNEVRVSDAPIASWGENRPAPGSMLKQPKKAK